MEQLKKNEAFGGPEGPVVLVIMDEAHVYLYCIQYVCNGQDKACDECSGHM